MTGVTPLPYPIRKVLAQKIDQNYEDDDEDHVKVNDAWYEQNRMNEKQIVVWPEYSEMKQLSLEASGSGIGGLETFQVHLFSSTAGEEDELHIMYKSVKGILTDHDHMIDPTYDDTEGGLFDQVTGIEHFIITREERFHKDKKRGEEVWRHVFWVHAKYNEGH